MLLLVEEGVRVTLEDVVEERVDDAVVVMVCDGDFDAGARTINLMTLLFLSTCKGPQITRACFGKLNSAPHIRTISAEVCSA